MDEFGVLELFPDELIPLDPVRNHGQRIVQARVGHPERLQNGPADVFSIGEARSALDGGTEQVISVGGIIVAGAGLGDEVEVLEDGQGLARRLGLFDVAFDRVIAVMADPPEMPEKLADGDGPFLPGKIGDISLDFAVQVDLPLFHEMKDGGGRDRLGDRGQPVGALRLGRRPVLDIGQPEPLDPDKVVLDKPGGQARDPVEGHLLGHEILEGAQRFGIPWGLFG